MKDLWQRPWTKILRFAQNDIPFRVVFAKVGCTPLDQRSNVTHPHFLRHKRLDLENHLHLLNLLMIFALEIHPIHLT